MNKSQWNIRSPATRKSKNRKKIFLEEDINKSLDERFGVFGAENSNFY
jgi:hypothetical protein